MNLPLRLTAPARAAIVAAAQAAYPREMVGLLGGTRNAGRQTVARFSELSNTAVRCDRFAVDPIAFAAAEARLRAEGLEFLGFAHSHPDGAPEPSAIDHRQLWPCCLQLIVGAPAAGPATLRVFRLEGDDAHELLLEEPPDAGAAAH